MVQHEFCQNIESPVPPSSTQSLLTCCPTTSAFRKAVITEANSFNMWSDARFPAAAPTLANFLNWMPSTEPQDDGVAEDIQESAEAALAATSQGI